MIGPLDHYSCVTYLLLSSFLSSISVLTMRLLQDSSRPLCFWSLHQSWSSRYLSLSGLPLSPSASLSLYSLHVHVHVKLHLVVFSPPSEGVGVRAGRILHPLVHSCAFDGFASPDGCMYKCTFYIVQDHYFRKVLEL